MKKKKNLNTKQIIKNNLTGSQKLTDIQIDFINLELMNFLVSDFEFFDGSDRDYIVKKFPAQFKKDLNEKYPELKENDQPGITGL